MLTLVAAACSGDRDQSVAAWTVEPSPPVVGMPAHVVVRLSDPEGRALTGARIEIEGHMSHPGMAPVVAPAAERAPGTYQAQVEFTMAGPWTMVAAGTTSAGQRILHTYEVPEVR